jgi:8-oxo-dGTP pyrophosphatase MutT (NUDIX family)
MQDTPQLWKKTGTTLHADCRIFKVHKVRFEHERRATGGDFFVMDTPNWVHVVALTPARELVMVQQFRFGTETLSWEVPGGLMESGESPEAAGLRELREETGFVGGNCELMASIAPNPAIQNNRCFLVLVRDAVQREPLNWDEHEEIRTQTIDLETADTWARDGTIMHSLSITSLFFLQRFL